MPQMIPMRAKVAFDRNGKHLKVGDQFTAFPIEAASLRYRKLAEFVTAAQPSQQSYQTRHMTAQTPGAGSPSEAPRASSAAPTQTADAESTQTTDGSRSSRRSRGGQGYQHRQVNPSGASEK